MTDGSPLERARDNAVEIVSMVITCVWMVAMFTGQSWWLPFMLVGYLMVVPVTSILLGEDDEETWDKNEATSTSEAERDARSEDNRDALETLRERYARGELTDEQFERKLERLLETETLEDVEDSRRSGSGTHDASADGELELDRER